MYYLGIDVGASSVKVVAVSGGAQVLARVSERHAGKPTRCASQLIERVAHEVAWRACAGVGLCGTLAPTVAAAYDHAVRIDDIPALNRGVSVVCPQAASIVEIGAQSSSAVVLGAGGPPRFACGHDCAAGSGAFLENQMERLGLPLERYSQLTDEATSVPRMSGRCAVFAKTDVIHCQQEGEPIENILLGLCYALARGFNASVAREVGELTAPVAFVGGVAKNKGVVRALEDVLRLGQGELIVADDLEFAPAIGAALCVADELCEEDKERGACGIDVSASVAALRARCSTHAPVAGIARLAPICGRALEASEVPSAGDGGSAALFDKLCPDATAQHPVEVFVGVDVGSTSTDVVLVDRNGALVDAQYLRTGGNSLDAVRRGLRTLGKRAGNRVRVVAVGTTGSGRTLVGRSIGADVVCNEITAQARAAAAVDPRATSVFEIGGQDSKFISLRDGRVADFRMNKICAAGTGSFIEEQAAALHIALDDFGVHALAAEAPLDLGERCTVFVESAVRSALAQGCSDDDVAAGLCLSVLRNYLHRVVASAPLGQRVILQGGVAFNPGIVAAFRALVPAEVIVSPWFAVSGAVGAALAAGEAADKPTAFKGWDVPVGASGGMPAESTSATGVRPSAPRPVTSVAKAEPALSDKPVKIGEIADSGSVDVRINRNSRFYAKTEELYLRGYNPTIDPAKKTIGVPRCLMLHKLFPMANTFFRELGFNVLLSDATDDEAVMLSQEVAPADVCLPVKLLHGHMEQLARRGVDYVFMPSIQTIRHAKSTVAHNYACVYLQSGPQMAARALRFEQRGIQLISPILRMDFGQAAMAQAMLGVGSQLGLPPRDTALAMLSGSESVAQFTRATEALGDELLASLPAGERVLVLITRNYGIADPVLNMGVPDLLLERGERVITLSHLHAHDVDLSADYPDLYWPFAQHIVSGARLVAADERLFAVYLTSHGCGPDSMVSHLFKHEMGNKPYLHLEVDEHASAVGIVTRIEAFLDAVSQYEAARSEQQVRDLASFPSWEGQSCAGQMGQCVGVDRPVAEQVAALVLAQEGEAPAGNALRQDESTPAAHEGASSSQAACDDADVPVHPHASHCCATQTADRVELAYSGLRSGEACALAQVGPHGALTAAWLEACGHAVDTQLLDADAVARGTAELIEGEYLTFAAFLGAAKRCVEQSRAACAGCAGGSACAGEQCPALLLPAGEGGDADGAYARVIETALADRAGSSPRVCAPPMELYPLVLSSPFALFTCLLAGDIVLAAPPSARAQVLATLQASVRADAGIDEVTLLRAARMARDAAAAEKSVKCVALVGEWPMVLDDQLTGGLWSSMESEGIRWVRMPFSEYLRFLWTDARASLSQRSSQAAVLPDDADARFENVLKAADGLTRKVHDCLGNISPFSPDLEDLVATADKHLHCLVGGNGRYRFAKAAWAIRAIGGVVEVSSLYENAGIAVRQLEGNLGGKACRLSFDGAADATRAERLRAFLHYL